ncbi:MAG: tRNA-dihydrouridine synthase, partial [Spirochaetota bacterium]
MGVLGIDVGTSGCKAALYELDGRCLATAAEAYPTMHPRPGWAELDVSVVLAGVERAIRTVVEAVREAGGGRVPCIGNGDVCTPFDARAMVEATGCDGVMIARAALGAPWLLRDTAGYLTSGKLPAPLTLRQRIGCVQQHFHHLLRQRGPRYAINRFKQKISRYAPHLGPCKALRMAVQTISSPQQFDAL